MAILHEGDIICVQTYPKGGGHVKGKLPYWDNVDRFTADGVGSKGYPGTEYIRIRSIDGNTADGYGISTRNRRLKPGDSLELTIQSAGANKLSTRFPWLDDIVIPEGLPGETLSVRITKINGRTAVGTLERQIDTLNVGDFIEANVECHSTIATNDEKQIELHLDKPAEISSKVQIQIDQLEPDISGHIVSYQKDIPEVGCLLEVEVKKSPHPQTVITKGIGRQIRITEPSRASGKVVARVNEIDELLVGEIESYRDLIPECGDLVEVDVKRGSRIAKHPQQEYTVQLTQDSPTDGSVYANIISTNGDLVAEIESYNGSLPGVGERITTKVSAGSSHAESDDGTFLIKLANNALISSTADIEITDISEQVHGLITDYHRTIPEIGERVKVTIEQTSDGTIGEPHNGLYSVEVINEESYTGLALVEIIEHGTPMIGKMIESRETDQQNPNRNKRSSPFQSNKNTNDLLSRTKF